MERLELYKGFRLRAYEDWSGQWLGSFDHARACESAVSPANLHRRLTIAALEIEQLGAEPVIEQEPTGILIRRLLN